MKKITIEMVKQNGWLIFEAIGGSKAYGLDTESSDTDIRGIFILPKELFYSLNYVPQISNASNDIVYYELQRFVELLSKNNPNIIEMLNIPEACVLKRDQSMSMLMPDFFLSKLCEQTFANYAMSQVKKAYGLEKKILNPMEKERKGVLDFCFVYNDAKAVPFKKYAEKNRFLQERAGLAAIDHLKDSYNLFYSAEIAYPGIVKKEDANDVSVSSIPKGEKPIGILYFNKDGYSVYCKKHKQYWEWVEKRNDVRYANTLSHGKNYDSKNMMHVFRLLLMAKEIAIEGKVNVKRNDRDFLFSIKEGKFEYDELLKMAEEIQNELPELYKRSSLKDEPNLNKINEMLVMIRDEYYQQKEKIK
jgi:predicted nucleotidyltransferase